MTKSPFSGLNTDTKGFPLFPKIKVLVEESVTQSGKVGRAGVALGKGVFVGLFVKVGKGTFVVAVEGGN
jgi:hypothetical protein